MKINEFTIISFYQFKKISKIKKLEILLKQFCQFNKLKGTILIAKEGINGNLGGFNKSIQLFEKQLSFLGFNKSNIKLSSSAFMPFYRLKIRSKKEIITFDKNELNVEKNTGKFIAPHKWNNILKNKDYHVIDLRNYYESNIGTFQNSFKTNTNNFIEFKNFIKNELNHLKTKKIAMFCTGGIRCEKASAYMKKIGFKDISQLQGGIIGYLNEIKKENSYWKGECFLFDNRVSIQNEMKKGTYELCHGCRMPINDKNKKSPKYEKGVSCEFCFEKLTEKKIKSLRQRNLQINLARKKGLYNPYIRYTPSDYS